MITSSSVALAPGSTITGKWNGNKYRIERLLGEGANGKVYLVRRGGQWYALKLGFDPLDHQLEVNVLRTLRDRRGPGGNYLYDVDDVMGAVRGAPFYVMRFVKGKTLDEYIRERGADWIYPIGLRLLRQLSELHARGYIFGDLKPENVMVSGYGDVELIDFGGVTPVGRSIRQFTEVYDRGYWDAGSRVADEAYDLFAFALICLKLLDRNQRLQDAGQFLPQNREVEFLLEIAASEPACRPITPFLEKALRGKLRGSSEGLALWQSSVLEPGTEQRTSSPEGLWIRAAFVMSLALCAGTLVYFWS